MVASRRAWWAGGPHSSHRARWGDVEREQGLAEQKRQRFSSGD